MRVVDCQILYIRVVQFPIVWMVNLLAVSGSKCNELLVVNLRGVSGTNGGAWAGVVWASVGCGESCGRQMLFGGSCAISAY